jgi:hypothetical protein
VCVYYTQSIQQHYVHFTPLVCCVLLYSVNTHIMVGRWMKWRIGKQYWHNRETIRAFICSGWGKPRKNSRCPGRDSKITPPEYESKALPLCQPVISLLAIAFIPEYSGNGSKLSFSSDTAVMASRLNTKLCIIQRFITTNNKDDSSTRNEFTQVYSQPLN